MRGRYAIQSAEKFTERLGEESSIFITNRKIEFKDCPTAAVASGGLNGKDGTPVMSKIPTRHRTKAELLVEKSNPLSFCGFFFKKEDATMKKTRNLRRTGAGSTRIESKVFLYQLIGTDKWGGSEPTKDKTAPA